MRESRCLLAQYAELSQQTFPTSRLQDLQSKFQKDQAETKSAIMAGRRAAQADVAALLSDRLHKVRVPKEIRPALKEEEAGRMVLLLGHDTERDETKLEGWGNAAHEAGKAVKKLSYAALMED